MKIIVLKELEPYSYDKFSEWFNLSEEKTQNIIKSLIIMNIIKKLSYDISNQELEYIFDTDSFDGVQRDINKDYYVFKYVGMVMIDDYCFFIYPKYIKDINEDINNKYKKFKQILNVIRKYNSKEQIHSIYGNSEAYGFNILSYILDLIKNYYEYGIYRNDRTIVEENGYGEILWEKTINENNAYFQNGVPIYLNLYTVNEAENEQDIFSRLHKTIITECCNEIKEIINILEITPVIISDEKIEDFGSKEYLIYLIKREISQQFITKKQEILYKLLSYLEREELNKSTEKISFVGTNSFNLVWEDVCASVKKDCLYKTFSEVGLKPYKGTESSDMLINIIPKPRWKHNLSGNIHEAKKTLIPDLISINGNKLSIYDAKYYNIKLNESFVRSQPGVGDVTKQYLYEMAFKKLADENNLVIERNAFLMPSDYKEEKTVGTVTFNLFSDFYSTNSLNEIEIILEPCELMYEKYLES